MARNVSRFLDSELVAVPAGTITATAGGLSTALPVTPQEFVAAYNAIDPGGHQLLWFVCDDTEQTVDGTTGLLTAWDDIVHPGAGRNMIVPAEAQPGAALTAGGQVAGSMELPASLALTGGPLFHADAHTLLDSLIAGKHGLADLLGDRAAGILFFGVARFVNGRTSVRVGEATDPDVSTIVGDDIGNVQALHVSPQWTKSNDTVNGTDPMAWEMMLLRTSERESVDSSHSDSYIGRRYCRDIVTAFLVPAGTEPLDSIARRLVINPGTNGAGNAHHCLGIARGIRSPAHTRLFSDWAAQRWPSLYEDTKNSGVLLGNSYQSPIQVNEQYQIVEGIENGRPAIPNFGMTNLSFFGQRPARMQYPLSVALLGGNDYSKRPPTNSVVFVATEVINGSGVTPGTEIIEQNFAWIDYLRSLDPARVRVVAHNLVYCSSQPFDQKDLNVPLLTDYLTAHYAEHGVVAVVDFLNSQMWSTDPYWYGEGDVNRGTDPAILPFPRLMWDGIHPNTFGQAFWRSRYWAAFMLGLGLDISGTSIEVYPPVAHVAMGPGALTYDSLAAGWQPRNYLNAPLAGKALSFQSSDTSKATVDAATGIVTALADGQALVIATSNDGAEGGLVAVVSGMATLDEISYLRNNLTGGDSAMLALYSTAFGVGLGVGGFEPGKVATWDDARGALGFGPQLAAGDPAGPSRPDWDAVNKLITFDGAFDYLSAANSPLFDLSGAKSLVLVAAIPQTTGFAEAAAITVANFARYLSIRQLGGAVDILSNNPDVNADSGVPVGATRRLVVASKDAGAGLSIDVPNHARVSNNTGAAQGAGNNDLTIGTPNPASSAFAKPIVRAVMVLNRQVTAGDLTVLSNWATTYHAAVLA